MNFVSPQGGIEFEVPDDWWRFCDMTSWNRGSDYYPYANPGGDIEDVEVVSISDIDPPARSVGVPLFKKYKFVPVLLALQSPECALPPITVHAIARPGGARYRVQNGFHRYYASVAVGYRSIPVIVLPEMPS